MERKLIGKFLVRRSTTKDGNPVIVLCGTFIPKNFKSDEISDSDEMWLSDITVHEGGARFTKCLNGRDAGSPEDFLSGENQQPEDWKDRGKL